MNRRTRRLLERKLGEDFPFVEFTALLGYYKHTMNLDTTEFMVYVLKRYIPTLYNEEEYNIKAMQLSDEQLNDVEISEDDFQI